MIEDNNKTSVFSFDIVDLVNLIMRETKKILIVTLLSISLWYIYYISHTATYDTRITIEDIPNVKFNYSNTTVSNYFSIDTLGDIKTQFLNNVEDYNNFKIFYENQEVKLFDNIDDFYNSMSISANSVVFTYTNTADQENVNNSLVDLLDYVHSLTLQNILDIAYDDLKNIETEISDMDYKKDLINEFARLNMQHSLSENLLRKDYNIKKTIRLLEENVLIAGNLGYRKPIGNIESYLFSQVAPISRETNNIFDETTNMVQSLSSDKPLFFLGTSVIETYLNILNEYNKLEPDSKRNFYPELIASIETQNNLVNEQYIEAISNYKVALRQTNRIIENFESTRSEPNLVRYDKNKIITTNQEVDYIMSFMISILTGLFAGILYVLFFDVYRRKNHIS